MKQINYKKLIIPNIPYLFITLFATKIGQGYRLTPGTDLSEKLLHLNIGFGEAFSSFIPSFHPIDLLLGIAIAVIIRVVVCQRKKRKKVS